MCFRPLSGNKVSEQQDIKDNLKKVSFRPLSGNKVSELIKKYEDKIDRKFPSPLGE